MLPEKFKAIIKKKKKSQYTHSFFLLYLNILHAFCSFSTFLLNNFPVPFLLQIFPFSHLHWYTHSALKNEAVEINYKA